MNESATNSTSMEEKKETEVGERNRSNAKRGSQKNERQANDRRGGAGKDSTSWNPVFIGDKTKWDGSVLVVSNDPRTRLFEENDNSKVLQTTIVTVRNQKAEEELKKARKVIWLASDICHHATSAVQLLKPYEGLKVAIVGNKNEKEIREIFEKNGIMAKIDEGNVRELIGMAASN